MPTPACAQLQPFCSGSLISHKNRAICISGEPLAGTAVGIDEPFLIANLLVRDRMVFSREENET